SGIYLVNGTVVNNVIQGNYIGTDLKGMSNLGNSGAGIEVDSGQSNIIGGTAPGERNVISGNGFYGVLFSNAANHNQALGNYIGTTADGAAPLGNSTGVGVLQTANSNTIGGTAA